MNYDPTLVLKVFGERIKQERSKKDLSQEQLSFKTGLDRTYISGIERGERNPSLKNIARIAQALEIQLRDLFSF